MPKNNFFCTAVLVRLHNNSGIIDNQGDYFSKILILPSIITISITKMYYKMKPFQPLISTALLFTIAFTSCTPAADKETTGNTDTTAAVTVNADDSKEQKLEANKKLVTDFYQSLYGDKDSTAVDKYVADNIKQHNPLLKDGKEWFKGAVRVLLTASLEKTKIDIKQVAADGDMVWLLVKDVAPNKKVFARVEIFRVENGKITENWKIAEPVAAKDEAREF
jgi:predicted SnoaL-like aldol condensation-catalyzing enzyme